MSFLGAGWGAQTPGLSMAPATDIQFWNSRQSLEGLSVRSVFFGVFQSFVVLLYILDNETNFVVQVSVFIGVLIDLWKITKVMDVRVRWPPRPEPAGTPGASQDRPHAWPEGDFAPGDFWSSRVLVVVGLAGEPGKRRAGQPGAR